MLNVRQKVIPPLTVESANQKFAGQGWMQLQLKANGIRHSTQFQWLRVLAFKENDDGSVILFPHQRYWVQQTPVFNGCGQFVGTTPELVYAGDKPVLLPELKHFRVLPPDGDLACYEWAEGDYRLFAPNLAAVARPPLASPTNAEELLAKFGWCEALIKPAAVETQEKSLDVLQVVQLSAQHQSWSAPLDFAACGFASRVSFVRIHARRSTSKNSSVQVTALVRPSGQGDQKNNLNITTEATGPKFWDTALDAIYSVVTRHLG